MPLDATQLLDLINRLTFPCPKVYMNYPHQSHLYVDEPDDGALSEVKYCAGC